MASCINDAIAENRAGRTHSDDFSPESPVSGLDALKKMRQALESDAASRQNSIDFLNDVISGEHVSGVELSAGDMAQLKIAGKDFMKQLQVAQDSVRKHQAEHKSFMNTFSGSTVTEASRWMNLTNAVAEVMADSTAPIVKWATTQLGVSGNNVNSHPLVQALRLMFARPHGAQQAFDSAILKVKNSDLVNSITARNSSLSSEDVLRLAGEYLNYLHAPELNAYLIDVVWPEQIRQLEAVTGRGSKKAKRQADELRQRIELLKADLDSVEPDPATYSSGYTNGQAEFLRQNLLDTHPDISESEFRQLAAGLRDAVATITQSRIEEGLIDPNVLAKWPSHFEWYVPFMRDSGNMSGAMNDVDVYDPGVYHSVAGSRTAPQNAVDTIMKYGYRASKEIGMRDLSNAMAAAWKASKMNGRDIGLRCLPYDAVLKALNSSSPASRNWAANILDANRGGGGIVALIPDFDVEGNELPPKRRLLTWRHDYQLGDKTGADLNRALVTKVKGSALTSKIGAATSLYGQMFTRFQPLFAPINAMRDMFERSIHLMTREYRDQNGNVVYGNRLVPRFMANGPAALRLLTKAVTGKIEPGSKDAEIWEAFRLHGLHLQYTRGMKELRKTAFSALDDADDFRHTIEMELKSNPKYAELNKQIGKFGDKASSALRVLDGWNDILNNAAPLAHFMTLREANLSRRAAAAGTLELMDLYQTGTGTPVLRALYAFVKPTVMSGAALARTMGLAPNARGQFELNKKGVATFIGLYAGYWGLMESLKSMMGEDENGNLKFDTMSTGQLSSFIPLSIGDNEYLKLPTGFGLAQVAITSAICTDRMMRGLMHPSDAAFEVLFSLGKNVSPGNFPEFSMSTDPAAWFAHMFAPAIMAPLTEAATGVNHFGVPIERPSYDALRPKADQGKLSTEREYHEFAKLVQNTTGLDLAPEQYKSWLNNLSIGVLRFIPGMVEQDSLRTRSDKPSTREAINTAFRDWTGIGLGPFFTAMGATRFFGTLGDTDQRLFYDALQEYQGRIRKAGVQLTGLGKKGAELDAEVDRILRRKGWSSEDASDAVQLLRADRELRSLNGSFSKEIRPVWMSADDSSDVKRKFDEFAQERAKIYSKALRNLNYYRQAQQ